jgi:hypothetical protein
MKRLKYFIGFLSFVLCLSSCEDILDVDSARYVTAGENGLASPNDSVSSVLGLLRGLQEIGDRYILFGEMRADLLDATPYTSAAIRELSDYTLSETNAYCNPRDYYDIINNCNYFISRTGEDDSPLKKENALVHAIRAWTYMQIVFNWGKAAYYTEPLLSVEDTEKDFPLYTIAQTVDALITDLEPFAEAEYPDYGNIYDFRSRDLFFPVKILLADLYLWRGASTDDYERSATYYAEYIDGKVTGIGMAPAIEWSYDNFLLQNFETSNPRDSWSQITSASSVGNNEMVTAIQMATEVSQGKTKQFEFTEFGISKAVNALWDDQSYVLHYVTSTTTTNYYTTGDLRKQGNIYGYLTVSNSGETITFPFLYKLFQSDHILIYRLGLLYLRYAEAVNRAGKPHTAFAVLKYGLGPNTFMDETRIPREELADEKPYITIFNTQKYLNATGIHARGCGDAAYDMYYVIGKNETLATHADTIQWIEDAICTELALETSFEGNRFQDLVRMATRRNDPSFLAKRIAAKQDDYNRIYNLLLDTKNWFLTE